MKPRTFLVKSESDKNKKYTITLFPDGRVACSCPHFTFKNTCKHADKFMKKVEEKKKPVQNKKKFAEDFPF